MYCLYPDIVSVFVLTASHLCLRISSVMHTYLSSLSQGCSLELFNDGDLIFQSRGKWLHPLFEAEDFIRKSGRQYGNLTLHDSISGLAAAFLTIRLSVRAVNVDMISSLALELYRNYDVEVHYTKLVDRIKCITETMISPSMTLDEAYRLLRKKADLTSGISLKIR